MHGVFLDFETLDSGDVDPGRLEATLPSWEFHAFTEAADIAHRMASANVVITNKCPLTRERLQAAPGLKLVALAATGSNNVDLEATQELGITVCNIRDYATEAVAQHCIALMLNLLSGQPWYMQSVQQGDWSRARQFCLQQRPIRQARGLVFGLVGCGVLGTRTAELAAALGMKVKIAERKGQAPRPGRVAFEDLVQTADVISLHCPLDDSTRNLFNRETLRLMKPGAILLNTARGGIVNETDLADALRAGVIAGAGIDTLSQEPPPQDHVLLAPDIPNLIVTPHNAWASRESRQAAIDQLAGVIGDFLAGQPRNLLTAG
ncbi:MAG TPA: D-2-hydroxyacid dehydrogenase [Xanthomonadales bacterium]|nr:D-2-hydroxyacid dehydrogenase [Xanthomonadales bacterium]